MILLPTKKERGLSLHNLLLNGGVTEQFNVLILEKRQLVNGIIFFVLITLCIICYIVEINNTKFYFSILQRM